MSEALGLGQILEGTRKVKAFRMASILGFIAFVLLVFRMASADLPVLVQYYFMYQGIITSAMKGFNFGEHWAKAKGAENGKS